VSPGSLVVVGTGIRTTQVTPEALAAIRSADVVHFLVADRIAATSIMNESSEARSLADLYAPDRQRSATYGAMVDRIMGDVRSGKTVCAAFYGHPGVYAEPGHDAVRSARSEGFRARMLPGVSAEDALFADLGIDPGAEGWQSYTATDFLLRPRRFDPTVPLVLWQVGGIGLNTGVADAVTDHLPMLIDRLRSSYPDEHEVVVYEAAVLPGFDPVVQRLPLVGLGDARITAASTLLVPGHGRSAVDPSVAAVLGIDDV